MTRLRDATPADLAALADLWNAGWHEAHAAHVPADLLAERTPESFRIRLERMLDHVRLAETGSGVLLGFCAIETGGRGELDQLFVAPEARGGAVATRLLADGEARLAAAGCPRPLLLCLPENRRAARFYARNGWTDLGTRPVDLATVDGSYRLPCLVFEKRVRSEAGAAAR